VLARVGARSPRPRWRPWLLPVAAAAVVVIASAALFVGHQSATRPAVPIGPPASATTAADSVLPSVVTSTPQPTEASTGAQAVTSSAAPDTTTSAPRMTVPRLLAIHMVTDTAGWALADAGLL